VDDVFRIAAAIRDYLGIPANLTFWEMANSELIIAVATLTIGVVVNRRVGRIAEKVDDNQLGDDLAKELQDRTYVPDSIAKRAMSQTGDLEEAEMEPVFPDMAGPAPQPAMAPRSAPARAPAAPESALLKKQSSFIGGADIIGKLKAYVDRVTEHVSDGRKKRKYHNLGKRDYRVRTLALEDDGVISHPVAAELLAAFDAWRPYSTNTAAVPDEVIALLERARDSLADSDGNLTRRKRRRNV
jgi:hypothetical protein